jgi:Kef-type K+ transport system membrane component KefB
MMLAAGPAPALGSHQLLIFLLQAGLLLLLALLLGRLSAWLGLTAIVGELCTGVLAGPSILAHVAPRFSAWLLPQAPGQFHLLDAVGQVGVLLLVGLTGMRMDLGLIRRRGRAAAAVGLGGLLVPLAFGVIIGFTLPAALVPDRSGRGLAALLLGVALSVSAIPVVAKIMLDLRMMHRDAGQLILCAAAIDDVAGWLLLSVCAFAAAGRIRLSSVAALVAGVAGVLVAAVLLRPLVRMALRAAGRSPDVGPAVELVACLVLLAAAATQALKLEAVIGAFVCGMVIRASGGLDEARVEPLETAVLSVFAPLYFATAGLRMDLTELARPAVLLAGVAVLLAAVVSKAAGAYAGARLSRIPRWDGLVLAAGINARGIIGVIVATTGLQLGVLSPALYTVIVLAVILTTVMTPPLLRWTASRAGRAAASGMTGIPVAGTDPHQVGTAGSRYPEWPAA